MSRTADGTDRRVTWVVIDDHGSHASIDGLPSPDRVVCADSGVSLALELGLDIDLVVGDLDSVPEHELQQAQARGAQVQRHPAAKDHTDLELALQVAAEDAELVIVVGGAGGRLDHALANVAALASDALAGTEVRARLGPDDVHVVRGAAELDLPLGATATLLPSGGPARGITTSGLRYPLQDGELTSWSARGVSNIVDSTPVRVDVRDGCLLVVVPQTDKDL
jgi:thiamine pyrophosphokinase